MFDDRSESGDRNASSNEHADDEMDAKEHTHKVQRVRSNPLCREHSVILAECGCPSNPQTSDSVNDEDKNVDDAKTTTTDNGGRTPKPNEASEKPSSSHSRSGQGSDDDSECKNVNEDDFFNMVVKTAIAQNQIPQDSWTGHNRGSSSLAEAMDTSDGPETPIVRITAIDCPANSPAAKDFEDEISKAPETDFVAEEIPVNSSAADVCMESATAADVSNANGTAPNVSFTRTTQIAGISSPNNLKTAKPGKKANNHNNAGNGDSGIDNVSDDSVPEESSSDIEKTEGENGLADISASRTDCSDDNEADRHLTRLSTYLKRSAEENDDDGPYVPRRAGDSRVTAKCCRKAVVFKRIAYSDVDSDDFDDFESDSGKESFPKDYEGTREKSDLSCYTYHMKQKINKLPLPQYLKMYLNFSRPI